MLNFNSKFKTLLGILSIMVVVNLVLSIALFNSGGIGISGYIYYTVTIFEMGRDIENEKKD